jgi:hypothetical protein
MKERLSGDQLPGGWMDVLTRRAAQSISRRTALKGTLGALATTFGLRYLSLRDAAADCCRTYFGVCVNCKSVTSGCSCNGRHCWTFTCSCGCGQCGNFRVRGVACDSGSVGTTCPGC